MTEPATHGPSGLAVIVIPFVEWGPLVQTCVASCLALEGDDHLICLVPDSLSSVPASLTGHPRVTAIGSGGPGIARKRNLAIKAHPEAQLFACLDSDAWPRPDWLQNARRQFELDPDLWLVGGPNLSPPDLPPFRQAVADALLSPLVSGPKAFLKRLSPLRDVSDLPSCNLVIRKEVVEAIGGFDESMEVGEDTVLCMEVSRRGKRIRFSPDVVVFHLPRRLLLPFVRQRFVTGWGSLPLLRRCHGTLDFSSKVAELLPALALLYLTLGGFLGFAHPALGWLWLLVLVSYLGLVALETGRHSSRPALWIPTAVAIVLGNLAPGAGLLAHSLGKKLRIDETYRNDE